MATASFDDDEIQQILVEVARESGFEKPKFEIVSATKPGDNYLGRVIRAIVREDGKEPLSLIFKIAPLSKVRRESLRSGILFSNEGIMYNIILPALNNFLRNLGVSSSEKYPYIPRCLRSRINEDWKENSLDILVLEDMSVKGYSTVERSLGLNADQCRAILRKLALLHAASLGLRHLRPEEAQRIESTLKDYTDEDVTLFTKDMVPWLQSKLSLVEDRYPIGSPEHTKLKNLVDNYHEIVTNTLRKSKSKYDCITHGDCWSNNVLFKVDKTGKIEDICLIDFQGARVTSPASDIVYLLFTCTTKKTRDEHYEKLLRDYHEEVVSILKTLGCDPESVFPWSALQEHLKIQGQFGLIKALITLPLFTADSSEVPENFDTLMDESKNANGNFTDMFAAVTNSNRLEECKERVSDVLLDCIQRGYM